MDQSKSTKKIKKPRRQYSLETANEMYKDAFLVKKTRFALQHPSLSDEQLNKMTALYFRKIAEAKRGQDDGSA